MTLPKKFEVNFTDNITITYNLVDNIVVDQWSNLIQQHTIEDCCPINHYIGYASEELVNVRIQRIYQLADIINNDVPDRVIKQEINKNNWKHALQLMHVHFPDLKNDENYKHLWDYLTEYNDIIHWLESSFLNIWSPNRYPSSSSTFRLNLDLNKSSKDKLPIPDESYKLFTSYFGFGDLMLHYCHVGKHAQELLVTNDFECPKNQFVPQREFTASIRMHFFDYFSDSEEKKVEYMKRWKEFYKAKGGFDYFGIDMDDPKIAFGYLKIGEIESISDRSIPITLDELNDFRDKLVNTQIINWNIKGA
jgi:hypothetical protein